MDAKQFIEEFGHIASAPGGMQRLRELLHSLAVKGKLCDLSEKDTPPNISLKLLERRRKEIISNHSLKATKKHKNLGEPLGDFLVPKHWEWEFLGYVSSWPLKDGDWIESKDQNPNGEVRLVQLADVGVGSYKNKSARYLTEKKAVELNCYFLTRGDVLIARLPDPLGRACIFPGDDRPCVTVVDVAICRAEPEFINPNYLVLCINSKEIQLQIENLATGTTRKRVATGRLGALSIPIPPIEEQARIVAKFDELIALCDKLEAKQQKKRQLQNQLRQATLQAVATAASPFELKQHWQRLQDNFEQLFSEPEDVKGFKGLLLDLAVSGKLLSEEYYDQSASGSTLLTAIHSRREKWLEEASDQELKEAKSMITKLRKQSVELPTDELPSHWQWATFLQISKAVIDCHNKTAPYVQQGIHLVRTTDIRDGKMDLRNTKKITDEVYDYWSRRMPPEAGDIFFTREAPMGEAAIVPQGEKICLGQRTMLLRLFPDLFSNKFLLYVIQSPGFQSRMIDAAIGMTVKHLRVGGVEDLFVPVPSRKEQEVINEILDQFFLLCEKFEVQLERKNNIAKIFAITAVSHLTGIDANQEEEPLKTPKTELIAPVTLGPNKPNKKDAAPLATLLIRQEGQLNANDLWQRFGGEIDVFYAQLKIEVAHGWIAEPADAKVLEKEAV